MQISYMYITSVGSCRTLRLVKQMSNTIRTKCLIQSAQDTFNLRAWESYVDNTPGHTLEKVCIKTFVTNVKY